jgi:hypothetical protein
LGNAVFRQNGFPLMTQLGKRAATVTAPAVEEEEAAEQQEQDQEEQPAKKPRPNSKKAWAWAQFIKVTGQEAARARVNNPLRCKHCPATSKPLAGDNVHRLGQHLLNPTACGFLRSQAARECKVRAAWALHACMHAHALQPQHLA